MISIIHFTISLINQDTNQWSFVRWKKTWIVLNFLWNLTPFWHTFSKIDTGKGYGGNKNSTHPVESNCQPATGGKKEEPRLCVQVLMIVKLLTESLLNSKGSDCVQTLERGTQMRKYWTPSYGRRLKLFLEDFDWKLKPKGNRKL